MSGMKTKFEFDSFEIDGQKPKIANLNQYLVWRFLNHSRIKSIAWPKEMVAANRLRKKYPELEFWQSLKSKYNSYTTLIHLTTEQEDFYLSQEYAGFKKSQLQIPQKEVIILQDTLVGESKIFEEKPTKKKSAFEFLND